MNTPTGPIRVLPLIPDRFSYARDLWRGVYAYASHQPQWRLLRGFDFYADRGRLGEYRPDGVVAFVDQRDWAHELTQLGVPWVNTSLTMSQPPGVSVLSDELVVGRLAAEHLLDTGLRRMAYVGRQGAGYSGRRLTGFRERLAEAGLGCAVYEHGTSRYRGTGVLTDELVGFTGFLDVLDKPAGVFCAIDNFAEMVAEYCWARGVRCPEEIAILGVNNDELICESCTPTLSSVQPDGEQVGYQAAGVLAAMLAGEPAPPVQLVAPVGVVARKSTDMLAIGDPQTIAAVNFIRTHVADGLDVQDVLAAVPMSRSSLERRFREHLGRTPLAEIHRSRVDRARELLVQTDLSVEEVAWRSGFTRPQRLATVFGRLTGQTPTQYRNQHRRR